MGAEMRNPAGWATGGAQDGSVAGLNTSEHSPFRAKSQRLCRAVKAAGDVLAMLPEAENPAELVADLALVWRLTLGPTERLALAAAGHWSLDAEASEALAEAALADAGWSNE